MQDSRDLRGRMDSREKYRTTSLSHEYTHGLRSINSRNAHACFAADVTTAQLPKYAPVVGRSDGYSVVLKTPAAVHYR